MEGGAQRSGRPRRGHELDARIYRFAQIGRGLRSHPVRYGHFMAAIDQARAEVADHLEDASAKRLRYVHDPHKS